MENEEKRLIVAITGGIGSGKSTAADILKSLGAIVINTDTRAKELMNTNAGIRDEIIEAFGEESYNDDGQLNARYISDNVFNNRTNGSSQLDRLNQIVHPYVIQDMIDRVESHLESGESLIYVESALVFEAGLEDGFDYIIVIDSKPELCISRAMSRSGMTEDEVKMRMAMQLNPEEKKNNADFVIENNDDLEKLKESVSFIHKILSGMLE